MISLSGNHTQYLGPQFLALLPDGKHDAVVGSVSIVIQLQHLIVLSTHGQPSWQQQIDPTTRRLGLAILPDGKHDAVIGPVSSDIVAGPQHTTAPLPHDDVTGVQPRQLGHG